MTELAGVLSLLFTIFGAHATANLTGVSNRYRRFSHQKNKNADLPLKDIQVANKSVEPLTPALADEGDLSPIRTSLRTQCSSESCP